MKNSVTFYKVLGYILFLILVGYAGALFYKWYADRNIIYQIIPIELHEKQDNRELIDINDLKDSDNFFEKEYQYNIEKPKNSIIT